MKARQVVPRAVIAALLVAGANINTTGYAAAQDSNPREIAVFADARVVVAADTVMITLLIEDTGKSAAEALIAADKKMEQVKKAVEALNAGAVASVRGSQLQAAGSPGAGLSGASAMRAQRLLGVKTSQVTRAGEIVDTALASGAQKAMYVDYTVENSAEAQLLAIKEASDRARKKAELLAQTLGVKLGGLLSATVTEDPEGAAVREQMRLGRDLAQFTEKEIHTMANLRFSVQ